MGASSPWRRARFRSTRLQGPPGLPCGICWRMRRGCRSKARARSPRRGAPGVQQHGVRRARRRPGRGRRDGGYRLRAGGRARAVGDGRHRDARRGHVGGSPLVSGRPGPVRPRAPAAHVGGRRDVARGHQRAVPRAGGGRARDGQLRPQPLGAGVRAQGGEVSPLDRAPRVAEDLRALRRGRHLPVGGPRRAAGLRGADRPPLRRLGTAAVGAAVRGRPAARPTRPRSGPRRGRRSRR